MINKDKSKKTSHVHSEEVINLYKSLTKTVILMMVTAFTIVFVAVAWFVSHSNVNGSPSDIAASNTVRYELACAGARSETEQNHLLIRQEGETLIWGGTQLVMGTDAQYDSYIDVSTGMLENYELDLHTSSGEIAWCLPDTISFYPGARGKLEFYVIPRVEGLSSVSVTLDLLPCKAVEDGNKVIGAVIQTDKKLNSLIDGHILLFNSLDDTNGYSGWLGLNPTIEISNSSGTLSINTPYKVTVYWIWPKQYRNLIYDKFATRGDLFANTVGNDDYDQLIEYINTNKSDFFYDSVNQDFPETSDQMSQSEFDTGILYYNQADEYIGKNANYIYVRVTGD